MSVKLQYHFQKFAQYFITNLLSKTISYCCRRLQIKMDILAVIPKSILKNEKRNACESFSIFSC